MSKAGAWLLDIGDHRAAVGVREQVHLMHEPEAAELAGAPAHCRHVIFWNGHCVPVMDLEMWLDPQAAPRVATGSHRLGIYAYQPNVGGAVEFGALWLAKPPQRINVDDDAAAPLPPDNTRWSEVALACFADAAGPVPILDLPTIFSGALNV
jgi:chemotaxis signal transduction protein